MPRTVHKSNLLSAFNSCLCISETAYNAIGNVIYSVLADAKIETVPENFLYKHRPYEIITLEQRLSGEGTKRGKKKSVAVLPLTGFIEHKQSALGSFLGGTSTEGFGRMLDSAVNNPDIDALIIDIDSPGGNVIGVPELSDKIFKARKSGKPIISYANPFAASAAYWLGSAAEHFVSFPSGQVGSVGVLTFHTDITQLLENVGVKETTFRATKSPYKAERMPSETLSEDAVAFIQSDIDAVMEDFIGHLGRNRGISTGKVEKNFGEGRVVSSKTAMNNNMIDAAMTYERFLGAVFNNKFRSGSKATAEELESDLEVQTEEITAVATTTEDFSAYHAEPEQKSYNADDMKRMLSLRKRSIVQ